MSHRDAVLQTDLYQLTMAAGYFHGGLAHTRATCEMFVRRLPRARRYLVAAGVEQAIDGILSMRFDEADIAWLSELPALKDAMNEGFADYLRDYRFRGAIWAVPEGTTVFAGTPLLRVEADIIEAQLIETYLLSVVNHATMIASKAARIVRAAQGRDVLEFGTRRTHPDAAVDVARAAYLVGAVGTSNVAAGRRDGIPVVGTAAHMWTMTHDSERAAFESYVATFPTASVLLIDTYDTVEGAALAAEVAGERLRGVRLDSGDLLTLSREVRRVLDDAGLIEARIVASGDLEEHKIAALLAAGAPIDVFGVGTELAVSKDAPALGGVYKVVAWERDGRRVPIMKLSEGKATYPGAHQVFRRHEDGMLVEDRLGLASEPVPDGFEALLVPRVAAGARLDQAASLEAARAHALAELARLPDAFHALEPLAAPLLPLVLTPALEALVAEVRASHE
ncbi:MAG: nicotinate phosphoribosyltransferase [Polyangiaceae bacterium]